MWEDLSAADVVRRIYNHLASDGWTCPHIATEFNSLGIPTSYRRDGRGVRGRRTQGLWRSGHIRNLVVNPVYRGLLQYGRRSTKPNGREVISASVSPLVSEDVWLQRRHRYISSATAPCPATLAMPRSPSPPLAHPLRRLTPLLLRRPEAEGASLIDARDAAQLRRKRAIDLYTRAKLSDDEFDAIAADVEQEARHRPLHPRQALRR